MSNNNSLEHWENRYKSGSWKNNNGYAQTEFWGKLIIDNLPTEIKNKIKEEEMSCADIGCSCGQLTNIFAKEFSTSKVVGYDFSETAIQTAKNLFLNVEFTSQDITEKFDCLILSNILEHYDNAFDMLVKFIEKSNKYVIILCPFLENPLKLVPEHCISIDEKFFVEKINDFTKAYEQIININSSGFWSGSMILCVYSKDQITIKPETEVDKIQKENLAKVKSKGRSKKFS